MKVSRFLVFTLASAAALAQQTTSSSGNIPLENPGGFNPVTLASQFFEHDFINFYAFANGIYDTYAPVYTVNGTSNPGSFGFSVGGGVQLSHTSRKGTFGLSYRGGYNEYQSSAYSSGTNQSLSLAYSRRLSRHWSGSVGADGAIFLYGGAFSAPQTVFVPQTTPETLVPTNPFGSETRYFSTYVSTTYQQTRRLSYSFSGNYFLNRYSYAGAVNNYGLSGSAAGNYRLTPRTTVGASYSHSDFEYSHGAGSVKADSFAGTFFRILPNHWSVSASGGFTQSRVDGVVTIPVILIQSNGQGVGGYVVGPYKVTSNFPSFSVNVSHNYRKSVIGASAGQGIAAGNGYILASKNTYFNGVYSRTLGLRRSILSVVGGYNGLSSVANNVATNYSSASISASWGLSLYKFIGSSYSYSYIYYGSLSPYPGISDNRFTFGLTFSSRGIPVTLY